MQPGDQMLFASKFSLYLVGIDLNVTHHQSTTAAAYNNDDVATAASTEPVEDDRES